VDREPLSHRRRKRIYLRGRGEYRGGEENRRFATRRKKMERFAAEKESWMMPNAKGAVLPLSDLRKRKGGRAVALRA